MGKFYFKKILFQEGWKKNLKISTDNYGAITEIIENFEGKKKTFIAAKEFLHYRSFCNKIASSF